MARIDLSMPIVSNTCEPAASAGEASEGALQAGALGGLGIADWLSLAAAPTFVAMACLTALSDGTLMICATDQAAFPLPEMAVMYLLMSAFHLAPWLRLLRRGGASDRKAEVSCVANDSLARPTRSDHAEAR